MKLTQQKIAQHLDLAQQNVSVFLKTVNFDWHNSTMDEVRLAYIRKLRAQSGAIHTNEGHDLVHERIMTERIDRELKMLNLEEKKAQLINLSQFETMMEQMVGTWKADLLGFDSRLKTAIDTAHGIDVDILILNGYTLAAFKHLERYDISSRVAASVECNRASSTAQM